MAGRFKFVFLYKIVCFSICGMNYAAARTRIPSDRMSWHKGKKENITRPAAKGFDFGEIIYSPLYSLYADNILNKSHRFERLMLFILIQRNFYEQHPREPEPRQPEGAARPFLQALGRAVWSYENGRRQIQEKNKHFQFCLKLMLFVK